MSRIKKKSNLALFLTINPIQLVMENLEKGSKKLLNAWAFYDWANSVYSLVISSAIFPIFYSALFKIKGIAQFLYHLQLITKTVICLKEFLTF